MQENFEVVVERRTQGAAQIVTLELAPVCGAELPPWTAGAHIDVQSHDGAGRAVQRQYSLCGDEDDARWRIAVLDAPGARGGARWLHAAATEGRRLRVSAPRNNFRLHDGAAPALLVAGGIGITPILAMARTLHRRGVSFRLHYYARSAASAAFIEVLAEAPFASRVTVSLDDAPLAQQQSVDRIFDGAAPGTQLYVCGPLGLMDAVAREADARGFSPMDIHRELFASAGKEAAKGNQAFELEIRSTGQVVTVAPDTTAVEALARAGIDVVVSCEQGLCGSCLTRVVEGLPEHRDQFLMPEEQARNDCFTPCCSRAVSARLVIDL